MKSFFSIKRIAAVTSLIVALAGLLEAALKVPGSLSLGGADLLFAGLAIGWILRSAVHGLMGYFRPIEKPGVQRYRLLRVSIFNALFGVLWLSAAVILLERPDPVWTAVAIVVTTPIAFLFALRTHAAVKAAGLERGSEWMRKRLRDPLEPGDNTVIGWILITLIECRSSTKKLSTFVAGTLAMLLVAILLVAPGTLAKIGGDPGNEKGLGSGTAQAPKTSPVPVQPCTGSFRIRS